jgi:hypothetical protein
MKEQLKISNLLQSAAKKRRVSDASSLCETASCADECLELRLQYASAGAGDLLPPEMIRELVNAANTLSSRAELESEASPFHTCISDTGADLFTLNSSSSSTLPDWDDIYTRRNQPDVQQGLNNGQRNMVNQFEKCDEAIKCFPKECTDLEREVRAQHPAAGRQWWSCGQS